MWKSLPADRLSVRQDSNPVLDMLRFDLLSGDKIGIQSHERVDSDAVRRRLRRGGTTFSRVR